MNHLQTRNTRPLGLPAHFDRGLRTPTLVSRSARVSYALLFLALALALLLSGCGNRGSLYLPDEQPLATGNPTATRPTTTTSSQDVTPAGDGSGESREGEEATPDASESADKADTPDTENGRIGKHR